MHSQRFQRTRALYAGRVYDGPFEGDHIEGDEPYYVGMFTRAIIPTPIGDPMPHSTVYADRVFYRWSRDIRAWVWIQKS